METVSIRNLRGSGLRQMARSGRPIAITNHRVLIGVLLPVTTAWIEHMLEYNLSHLRASIAEGERAMAGSEPVIPAEAALGSPGQPGGPGADAGERPGPALTPLAATVTGGTVTQAPQTRQVIERFWAAFNPGLRQAGQPGEPSVATVRIGDLSAAAIEQAGQSGQTLAITHDRELIGFIIPVTQELVQYLIEQNMSRVLHSVALGEKQLSAAGGLTHLDQIAGQETIADGGSSRGPLVKPDSAGSMSRT